MSPGIQILSSCLFPPVTDKQQQCFMWENSKLFYYKWITCSKWHAKICSVCLLGYKHYGFNSIVLFPFKTSDMVYVYLHSYEYIPSNTYVQVQNILAGNQNIRYNQISNQPID
jgi:hypothetical protein